MVDVVLRYRPETKTKRPRERKKRPKTEAAENKEPRDSKL
jgi:hypothetical protein